MFKDAVDTWEAFIDATDALNNPIDELTELLNEEVAVLIDSLIELVKLLNPVVPLTFVWIEELNAPLNIPINEDALTTPDAVIDELTFNQTGLATGSLALAYKFIWP